MVNNEHIYVLTEPIEYCNHSVLEEQLLSVGQSPKNIVRIYNIICEVWRKLPQIDYMNMNMILLLSYYLESL